MKKYVRATMFALAVLVMAVALSCGPRSGEVSPEALERTIGEAVEDYLVKSREKAQEAVLAQVKEIAEQEMKRLNAIEQLYKDKLREVMPLNPMLYGHFVKQYRHYDSYTLVDVIEDPSIFVSYTAKISYHFKVFETKRYSNTFDENARAKARAETEFHETDQGGNLVLSYVFGTDLKWDGEPGRPSPAGSEEPRSTTTGPQLLQKKRFDAQWVDQIKMR